MPCIIFCTLLRFSRHIRSCIHYYEFNWVKIFRFLSSMLLLDIIRIVELPKICWIFTPFFSINFCYTIKRYWKIHVTETFHAKQKILKHKKYSNEVINNKGISNFLYLVRPENGSINEMVFFCLSPIFVGCVIQSSHITPPRSFGFELFN